MYQGRHSMPGTGRAQPRSAARRENRPSAKPMAVLISLILLFTLAIGGSIAWLNAATAPVVNQMEPGKVPIEINETFDGITKSNVSITNKGNIQAYVRVAIVANAVDKDGNVTAGEAPSYEINTQYWTQIGGYYYYNGIVEPDNGTTAPLFTGPVNVTGGEVNILAESIQVLGGINGQTASQAAWHAVYNGSTWSKTA